MTDDRIKLLTGSTLVILLVLLAGLVAVGKVEERFSFGLQFLLGMLSAVVIRFAEWAWPSRYRDKEKTVDGTMDGAVEATGDASVNESRAS
jgi:hypothetical protein